MPRRSLLSLRWTSFLLGLQMLALTSQASQGVPVMSEAAWDPPAGSPFEDPAETSLRFTSFVDLLSVVNQGVMAQLRSRGSGSPAVLDLPGPDSGSPLGPTRGKRIVLEWDPLPPLSIAYNDLSPLGGIPSALSLSFRDFYLSVNSQAGAPGNDALDREASGRPMDAEAEGSSIEWPGGNGLFRPFSYHGNQIERMSEGGWGNRERLPGILAHNPELPGFHRSIAKTGPETTQPAEPRFEVHRPGEGDLGEISSRPRQPNALGRHVVEVVPEVPEPAVWALLGLGSAALAVGFRSKRW